MVLACPIVNAKQPVSPGPSVQSWICCVLAFRRLRPTSSTTRPRKRLPFGAKTPADTNTRDGAPPRLTTSPASTIPPVPGPF
jgi:hypothetical protein